MTKMHENEFEIDEKLVRTLLENQCPNWANLPLTRIQSSGTDNALFRLGEHYVVRLPRLEGALATINKEYEWLPKLAPLLKTPISTPVFKGNPIPSYPSHWMIVLWNEGHNPAFEKEQEHEQFAVDLANFITELHRNKLTDGPRSRRGVPLTELDEETMMSIHQLEGEIDTPFITSLWKKLSSIPYWPHEPVWIHGDLLPGNILIQNNQLSAVIDFADVGMGDPACDLIPAWCLLNDHSRAIFRKRLPHIDDNTWARGQGWALSIALIIMPYYKKTNPVLYTVAKRMLNNVRACLDE